MRIKKLVIYGYGKWIDAEFDLDLSLQLFYGQNEAGKSTLMSFIHSILFGFPTRHSSSLRYEPKESSRYGGKVILDDSRFGEVSIERVNGKVTGDVVVTLEDGTQGDERLLESILYNKKRQFYESIYSFNLKGVEETSEMNREQFNRFFLSVGSFGNEGFLKRADSYNQKASQLFKPTGRKPKLNQLFHSLQKQKVQLNKVKEKNEEYVSLVEEKETLAKQVDVLENNSMKMREKSNEFQHLLKNSETIDEINELKKEIDHYPSYSLPEDGLIHLKHINKQIQELREETTHLYDKQKMLQEKYRPSKDLLIYQEHEEAVNKLLNDWAQLETKIERVKESQQDLSHLEKQSFEFKLREGLPLNELLPKKLNSTEKNDLVSFSKKLTDLKEESRKLEEKLQILKLKTDNNNERIDVIEQSLWSSSKFKEVENLELNTASTEQQKNKTGKSPAFVYSIGIMTIGLLYLLLQTVSILLLIPLYVILAAVVLRSQSSKSSNEGNVHDPGDYYHQKSLREQWKEILASNDLLQQEINKYEDQLHINRGKVSENEELFLLWKVRNNYPENYEIATVFSSLNQLNELRQIEELRENTQLKVTREISELTNDLMNNEFAELFFEEGKDVISVFSEVRNSIRKIENDKRMQQSYIKETEKLQNSILYYVQQEKDQLKMKNDLFLKAGVKTEDDFLHVYNQMAEKRDKVKRYRLLQESINIETTDSHKYTVEGLRSELVEINERSKELQAQKNEATKNMIEIDYKISELEEGGMYSDLLQKYENERSVYQEIADEWSTYKIAAALIEYTLNNAKENQLPQTIKLAEDYLSFITSGEYTSITLEAEQFYVTDNNGKKWQASELSRGTVEPLYIAIRLAFVISNKEKIRFPVIVDDSFVNIDDNRKKAIYELLNDLSEVIQIIYFTFDKTTLGYIDDDHVIKLD